ncbi:hypothetical protein BDZ91DRAFT_257393 [Kalaharituber pfeilii]|nr:hypothetical protein BDZ91DRAFT_257393 [Kalaharituber pfeilii]
MRAVCKLGRGTPAAAFALPWLLAICVSSHPVPDKTILARGASGTEVIATDSTTRQALLWTSIAVAVFVALIQSLVATMATIAEDSRAWTFRFRLALYEHWWYTWISVLLGISLILIVLSFLAGNNGDALGILVLSSATGMTIVRYAVPAWRGRGFIVNRWLAWTGASRTAIPREKALLCGDAAQWARLCVHLAQNRKGTDADLHSTSVPSDDWGWTVWPPSGIAQDATEILAKVTEKEAVPDSELVLAKNLADAAALGSTIYNDGLAPDRSTVSLQWGSTQGFRRRVSRGISSMPINLLLSRPVTVDGYSGEGLCLAMAVLARNKGLLPNTLIFDAAHALKREKNLTFPPQWKLTADLENGSTWAPRPQKALRSYNTKAMESQVGTIGADYLLAAVELALIFADCPAEATKTWLQREMAQQDIELNRLMHQKHTQGGTVTAADLNAMYRASYVSMVMSLNNMRWRRGDTAGSLRRPDLLCGGLLVYAETGQAPAWWGEAWARDRVQQEVESLAGVWRKPMAGLVGLVEWPAEMPVDCDAQS